MFVMQNGTHPYLPYKEWTWANDTWKVKRGSVTDSKLLSCKEESLPADAMIPVRQEMLTGKEIAQAIVLAEQILRDPLFGFSYEDRRNVQNKSWKSPKQKQQERAEAAALRTQLAKQKQPASIPVAQEPYVERPLAEALAGLQGKGYKVRTGATA